MAKDDDDEIVIPKRSTTARSSSASGGSSTGASLGMRKLMRVVCGIGIFLGGSVTLVGVMSVVGLVTDNLWARLIIGVLIVFGLPAFLADRLLKRSSSTLATKGGLGMVASVFAIVLLGIALMLVGARDMTGGLLAREGDRYARSGSTFLARTVYFLAGVAPVFPHEKPAGLKANGAVSGTVSGTAAPSAPPAPPSTPAR